MNEYESFIRFYEENEGLEFPCTAPQFWARAQKYAERVGDSNGDLVDRLCQQGIGPDWRE